MSTTNLGIDFVDVNQSQKEVTMNAAIQAFEDALTAGAAVAIEDGLNVVLAADFASGVALLLAAGSPGPSAGFTLSLPAVEGFKIIQNDSGYEATVVCSAAVTGSSEATIPDGDLNLVFCDGSQVFRVAPSIEFPVKAANLVFAGPVSGGDAAPDFRALTADDLPAQPFDVGAFFPGVPTDAAVMLRVPVARAITIPADFAGSYGKASAASTGTVAFDIQKNGTTIGTATFTAAATATFTTVAGAAQSLAAGDVLSIVCPGTADATLADIGFVLVGSR